MTSSTCEQCRREARQRSAKLQEGEGCNSTQSPCIGVRVLQVLAPFVVIAGGLAGWALHYALNVEVGGTAAS